jgi:hypothetical protein
MCIKMINERERELLTAAGHPPIAGDLLEFSEDEVRQLSLTLAIRRLAIIICNDESAPKDVVAAARLIFQLNGKDVGGDPDDPEALRAGLAGIQSELIAAAGRSKASE